MPSPYRPGCTINIDDIVDRHNIQCCEPSLKGQNASIAKSGEVTLHQFITIVKAFSYYYRSAHLTFDLKQLFRYHGIRGDSSIENEGEFDQWVEDASIQGLYRLKKYDPYFPESNAPLRFIRDPGETQALKIVLSDIERIRVADPCVDHVVNLFEEKINHFTCYYQPPIIHRDRLDSLRRYLENQPNIDPDFITLVIQVVEYSLYAGSDFSVKEFVNSVSRCSFQDEIHSFIKRERNELSHSREEYALQQSMSVEFHELYTHLLDFMGVYGLLILHKWSKSLPSVIANYINRVFEMLKNIVRETEVTLGMEKRGSSDQISFFQDFLDTIKDQQESQEEEVKISHSIIGVSVDPDTSFSPIDEAAISAIAEDIADDTTEQQPTKENKEVQSMFDNLFNGIFGKIEKGVCRIAMNGKVAIKTTDGSYKTYDLESDCLTIVNDFTFGDMDELFFVMPTTKVVRGDTILIKGRPMAVVSNSSDKRIEVIDYDSNSIQTVLPERHIFMGCTYFYGKVISLFGSMFGKGGRNGFMKLMMLQQILGNGNSGSISGLLGGGENSNPLVTLMLLNSFSGGGDLFSGLFDDDFFPSEDDTMDYSDMAAAIFNNSGNDSKNDSEDGSTDNTDTSSI